MNSSVHSMQRYILGAVGLMTAMAVTLPIAMVRVSHSRSFSGQAVKSHDCTGQIPKTPTVVSWVKDCLPMNVSPKK